MIADDFLQRCENLSVIMETGRARGPRRGLGRTGHGWASGRGLGAAEPGAAGAGRGGRGAGAAAGPRGLAECLAEEAEDSDDGGARRPRAGQPAG